MLKDGNRVERGEVLTVVLNEFLKETSGNNNGTGNLQGTSEQSKQFY
jgi:hypothetical protein